MSAHTYRDWPGFETVYLEDSFVLRIDEGADRIAFDLELVLLPGHALYAPPIPGEVHCYRLATLEFAHAVRRTWQSRSSTVVTGANGDVDLGSVDVLVEKERGTYYIEGDWGAVEIQSNAPVLRFE